MVATIRLTVNGKPEKITTDPDRPLLEVLRDDLALIGSHFGCGAGDCGACGVLIDGKRVFSCITPISDVNGRSVTTIEGLADGEKLHPVQQAFLDEGAYQCGYCIPGMIVAATALLKETPSPSDDQINTAMNGNLCRCCGYVKVTAAIKRAATAMAGGVR